MKDPATAIRTAYFSLLNGMTVGGKLIKLYDSVAPDNAVPPYLIIKSQQTLDESTKTGFGADHRITLASVARWTGDTAGKKPAEEVANAALALIMPAPGAVGLPQQAEFHIYTATWENGIDVQLDTKSGTDYQRVFTIKHLVQEL
ncbi:tail completion protein gp17 [Larkinella terrae]|uniref:DUF3168 domain-containing protein n=1 Tax=Larkinella terrae TaxID=2025311 RepID=A0A7K0EIW2_9BACT|nr:DUF3168 domain-containing protein [Larkinella terrae]MRS61783.1 DUF3168 domain-containing protein [Larkinella terrae]